MAVNLQKTGLNYLIALFNSLANRSIAFGISANDAVLRIVIANLKLVSAIFYQIFVFSSNDRTSKTMKNVSYFI